MRKIILAGVLTVLATPALADDMYEVLPGLMCESPDALAKLTLPDGSSRTAVRAPSAADLETKSRGRCVEMPGDVSGTLVSRRRNTSIISVDRGGGQGPVSVYVPNIDFGLAIPNLAALRAASPAGAIPASCPMGETNITVSAVIRSAMFTPDAGAPYRYRYLVFPSAECVTDGAGGAAIANVASLKGSVRTAAIPDGSTVTVSGQIGAIDTGNQPLTMDFIASRVSRR